MGRDVREQLEVWDRIEAAGGEVVSVQEGIDGTSAHSDGRLQRNLLISINAHQREKAQESWRRRRRLATEAGIWQSPKVPKGYLKGEDRHLYPDPVIAPLVEASFEEILAGTVSIRDLAERLDMSPSGIQALLRNRVYLGEVNIGGFSNPKAHPAIVKTAVFDGVQRKLGEAGRGSRAKDEAGEPLAPALLSGLVRCASCGHVMSRTTGNPRQGYIYKCRGMVSGGRCPATCSITAAIVDQHVEEIALVELERLQVEASESVGEVRSAQSGVEAAERELAGYLEAVSAVDVGAEAFAAGARTRRAAVEDAKDTLYRAMARQPADAIEGSGNEVWAKLDAHERNTLLRGLFDAVIVRPAGRGKVVPVGERTRVLAHGAGGDVISIRAGIRQGIAPIPFPNTDAVGVLAVAA